jgi:hypothetical protein
LERKPPRPYKLLVIDLGSVWAACAHINLEIVARIFEIGIKHDFLKKE